VHGNLFEELRNNAMDARGFFAAQTPILKQHDFGGTVGGPIYIPKVYNGRNKTFFFATYQGFRNRAGRTPSYQPSLRLKLPRRLPWMDSHGVMADLRYFWHPAQPERIGLMFATCFPNNTIPQNRFSGVATRFIALRPTDMVPNTFGRNAFGDPVEKLLPRRRQHQFALG